MSQTDFNWSAYAKAIGSKDQAAMEIADRVQPVIIAADLSSLAPQHVPRSGYAGVGLLLAPAAGRSNVFQIASLDPGGCYVELMDSSLFGVFTDQVPIGGLAPVNYTATLSPEGNPLSTIGLGNRLSVYNIFADGFITVTADLPENPRFFVPRGSFLTFEQTVAATLSRFACKVTAVPATQGGDA